MNRCFRESTKPSGCLRNRYQLIHVAPCPTNCVKMHATGREVKLFKNVTTFMGNSRWLESYRHYVGKKPGPMLAKLLNEGFHERGFIEILLSDAQLVCHWLQQYKGVRELNTARKQKKVPPELWEAHSRLNETLASFLHAPQVDIHDFGNGERVTWILQTTEPPLALLSVQLRCILQLIEQNLIHKVRRCSYPECNRWYFARRSDQEFCCGSCRWNAFASTPAFKKKKKNYMQNNYQLKKSGKVKTK